LRGPVVDDAQLDGKLSPIPYTQAAASTIGYQVQSTVFWNKFQTLLSIEEESSRQAVMVILSSGKGYLSSNDGR